LEKYKRRKRLKEFKRHCEAGSTSAETGKGNSEGSRVDSKVWV